MNVLNPCKARTALLAVNRGIAHTRTVPSLTRTHSDTLSCRVGGGSKRPRPVRTLARNDMITLSHRERGHDMDGHEDGQTDGWKASGARGFIAPGETRTDETATFILASGSPGFRCFSRLLFSNFIGQLGHDLSTARGYLQRSTPRARGSVSPNSNIRPPSCHHICMLVYR